MDDKSYLIKVLGLSSLPRIFTFLFTFFSFPIMLRQVGTSEYGVIVYLSSIVAIFESFADFGVSSAAGKEISRARLQGIDILKKEILNWFWFQIKAALIGLIPMAIATYYIVHSSSEMIISNIIIALILASSWVTIISNFVRAVLTATLSFKSLAILDTLESVSRSSLLLCVAFYKPSAMGLAIASILSGLFISITAFLVLFVIIKKYQAKNLVEDGESFFVPLSDKEMLKESINFLWLRLASRCFNGLPILILGSQFNSGVVGVVGTVQRMVDLLTFPFAVIGNALAVKGKEFIEKGNEVIQSVWDVIFRIISVAVIQWAIILVGAGYFSAILFTNDEPDYIVFALLTITIFSTSVSVIVNPLIDYAGALRKRIVLLSIVSIVQIPFIFVFSNFFGVTGAISAYVLVLVLINYGFLLIALRSFFPNKRYTMLPENSKLIFIVLVLLIGIIFIQVVLLNLVKLDSSFNLYVCSIALFLIVLFGVVLLDKKLRKFYVNRRFFEFRASEDKGVI